MQGEKKRHFEKTLCHEKVYFLKQLFLLLQIVAVPGRFRIDALFPFLDCAKKKNEKGKKKGQQEVSEAGGKIKINE